MVNWLFVVTHRQESWRRDRHGLEHMCRRAFLTLSIVGSLSFIGCASIPPPVPRSSVNPVALEVCSTKGSACLGPTDQKHHSKPSSAELMSTAYLAIVRESIVPANPRVVAIAALTAIASLEPERARSLPSGFGADAERDAAWLAERVAGLPAPWPVLGAMTRATGTAHVGLSTPTSTRGMRALITGKPLSAHGFNVYPLADGRFVVFDVIKGASADLSGLHAGDVLVRIGSELVTRQVPLLLPIITLPAGAELTLGIERANRPAEIVLRLIEADIPPVESRLLADGIAYVHIRWFARSEDSEHDTAALARRAFESLAAQGARGLVLDLRSALGGIGDAGIASALSDGDVVYYVKQPLSEPARPVKRDGKRYWPDRPIVVLVNEQTISAGEALALAVRELAHAKVVGQTSAGGLTEGSFIALADDHALLIPTGVVLGPVTRVDQPGHAIKPDIEVPNPTIDELISGRDRQLEAARAALATRPPRPRAETSTMNLPEGDDL